MTVNGVMTVIERYYTDRGHALSLR